MLRNDDEYEAALEEVLRYLEHPSAAGTPADWRLDALLQAIAEYRSPAEAAAPAAPGRKELDALRRRILERSKARRPPFGIHEHGIGPTLGMDLGPPAAPAGHQEK